MGDYAVEILIKAKDLAQAAIAQVTGELQGLSAEAKGATGNTGMLKGALGGLVAGATVAGAGALVKNFIDASSAIEDMHERTDLGYAALQRFKFGAEQTGTTLEAVVNAVQHLQKNLVDGDNSTVGALGKLGLSLEELRDLKPEDQFELITSKIAAVQDPAERTQLRMALLGKAGKDLAADFKTLGDEAQSAGLVLSDGTIKAADDTGDAFDKLLAVGKSLIGSVLGPLMPVLSGVAGGLASVAGWLNKIIDPTVHWARVTSDVTSALQALNLVAQDTPNVVGAAAAGVETWKKAVEDRAKAPIGDTLEHEDAIVKELTKSIDDSRKKSDEAAEATKRWIAQYSAGSVISAATEAVNRIQQLGGVSKIAADKQAELYKTVSDGVAELQRAGQGNSALAQKLGDVATQLRPVLVNQRGLNEMMAQVPPIAYAYAGAISQSAQELLGLTKTGTLASHAVADMNVQIAATPAPLKASSDAVDAYRNKLGPFASAVQDTFAKLPGLIQQGLTGGGGIGGALKAAFSNLGSDLGGSLLQPLFDKLKKPLIDGLGKTFGGAISAMIPGIGSAIGALAGPLVNAVGGLFSKIFKRESIEVNKLRESFVQAHGGLAALNKMVVEAGGNLDTFLKVSKKDDLAKQIDYVNQLLGDQVDKQAHVNDLLEKYGISWEKAGDAVKKANIAAQAEEIVNDFTDLTKAGVDVVTVTGAMKDKINAFVAAALRTGQEIPASMKPVLQKMVDLGELTDENGNKLTDLSKLTFAETLTQGFDRVVGKLDTLIDRLGGVSNAVGRIPTKVNIDVQGHYTPPDIPDSRQPDRGYASGTTGTDFGRESVVRTHGREAIVPLGSHQSIGEYIQAHIQAAIGAQRSTVSHAPMATAPTLVVEVGGRPVKNLLLRTQQENMARGRVPVRSSTVRPQVNYG